jgi:hypothetical protein
MRSAIAALLDVPQRLCPKLIGRLSELDELLELFTKPHGGALHS